MPCWRPPVGSWPTCWRNNPRHLRFKELPIQTLNRLLNTFSNLLRALYDPEAERGCRWLSRVWLPALFLGGALLWGKFLNWGRIPFDFHDWAEVNAPRLAFMRDAVIKGVLPLHMPDSSALRNVTDRFMSLPDVILSPQVLLMRWMEIGPFVLVNTLLFYALGAWGLLWFRRRFDLGLVPFSALFLLFNFNGHILTHMSIGHITWNGYFLFPWVLALVFRLLDGGRSWRWVAKMALLLFFMFLNGSYHHFVWVLLFLGLLALGNWHYFWPVVKTSLFAVLLSMVRILPPALHLNTFDSEFLGGYPTLMDILSSLVTVKFPEQSLQVRSMLSPLGWWEYSLYLGLLGTLFLAVFGIYRWVKNRDPRSGYPALLLPILGVALLSLGRIYRVVRLVPVPLLSGERASIRMIILPVAVLLILAAGELQSWLRGRRLLPVEGIAGLGLLLALGHDLWQHLKVWQVSNAFAAFPVTPVNLAIKVVANHPDPAYTTALALGAGVSLISLLVLLSLAWRR
ncbi:MAG: hypothetical protein IT308_13455 [Anaerolineaceae bacterium]|nr:hypothetical protein [Anaerolineaceae bacterium]